MKCELVRKSVDGITRRGKTTTYLSDGKLVEKCFGIIDGIDYEFYKECTECPHFDGF
jgi:hypothetical protein